MALPRKSNAYQNSYTFYNNKMKKIISLIAIAMPIILFVSFGAQRSEMLLLSDNGEDFREECQREGCDTEETEELHESYESECFEENCQFEEVREIAGRTGSINAMMNNFQNRGWTVNNCHRWGGCVYSPGNNNTSGDVAFGALCTQSSINQHWADFDFDKGDWDEGFGYNDPCNINLPLGRTFNALNLLDFFGRSMPNGSSNWLPWFYAYASNKTDELDARCGFGQANGCTFARSIRGLDDRVELYWPFFYRNIMNVASRAATIVHESRHQDGKGHNCNSCANGGSCDTNWGYRGANYMGIMYLWWLRAAGDGVSPALRAAARTRGNVQLGNRFCSGNPTRGQVLGSGVSNAASAFRIP